MHSIYIKNINFRVRKIANRNILFGNGKTYELNESARFVWDNINGKNSVDAIVENTKNFYDCSRELVENDLKNTINFLAELNAIEELAANE